MKDAFTPNVFTLGRGGIILTIVMAAFTPNVFTLGRGGYNTNHTVMDAFTPNVLTLGRGRGMN